MEDLYNQMLSMYSQESLHENTNVLYEINQQIILSGLYRGGFFDKAAFYGGTCLRIFHGLNRFSEDLDFSLLKADSNFKLEDYFDAIIQEFQLLGHEVEIVKKDKKLFTSVESAFLKDNTSVYDIQMHNPKTVKIKIEVDTNPPLVFSTEQKLALHPQSFMVRCYTLPDLFAGKMHALLFRKWKNRIKGRDWYDFEWYVRKGIPLNFEHLQERLKQFNNLELNQQEFRELLEEHLSKTDISLVKKDVLPFLKKPEEVEIWSNQYFLELSRLMKIQ